MATYNATTLSQTQITRKNAKPVVMEKTYLAKGLLSPAFFRTESIKVARTVVMHGGGGGPAVAAPSSGQVWPRKR